MPQGLQVFDTQGRLVSDHTSRFGRVISVVTVTTADTGAVAVEMKVPGTFFILPSSSIFMQRYIDPTYCDIWLDHAAKQVKWQWYGSQTALRRNIFCLFGVY